jgi:hypothetical protein
MNWLELLRAEVERHGRRIVEADLGISKTTMSQVLNEKYPGNLGNIEAKVLGKYSTDKVCCPVLGEITEKRCAAERVTEFRVSNPQRIKLWKACQSCPFNINKGADE